MVKLCLARWGETPKTKYNYILFIVNQHHDKRKLWPWTLVKVLCAICQGHPPGGGPQPLGCQGSICWYPAGALILEVFA